MRKVTMMVMIAVAVTFTAAVARAGTPEPGKSWVIPHLDLKLVWIEPGTFTMGSVDVPPAMIVPEYPAVRVTLTQGYWIGEVTVNRSQWRALIEDKGTGDITITKDMAKGNDGRLVGNPRLAPERLSVSDVPTHRPPSDIAMEFDGESDVGGA